MKNAVGLAVAIAALRQLGRSASASPVLSGAGAVTPVITYEQAKGRPYSAGPPQLITLPAGWRRMRGEEVGAAESAFARRALRTKGTPGNQQTEVMPDGTEVLALTEWHYHDPPIKPTGWHHGITLLVRTDT